MTAPPTADGPPDGAEDVAGVHPAARAFDGAAERYERGRPGYPPEAVRWLSEVLGIGPGTTVVDLAAGTGKLTRLLVPTGATVVAVDPVPGMRRVLTRLVPGVTMLDGTAECLPLPSASVDAVVVAQAFHWFDGPVALAEIHRVLRPGGGLGLLWNRRHGGRARAPGIEGILDRHRGTTPTHHGDAWRQAFERTTLFGPLGVAAFALDQVVDADGLVDRALSISFNASLGADDRHRLERELRSIAAGHGGTVVLHYDTDVYWCHRA